MVDRVKLKRTNENRTDEYHYLRFIRPNETISRVDRYSIIMYWDVYTSKGNPIQVNDFFFYPSEFGMDEIEKYKNNQQLMAESSLAPRLVERLEQLIKYGNPYWKLNVNTELTSDNWILREPLISSFNPTDEKEKLVINYADSIVASNKKTRVKLKTKNNRIKLKTKR
jgi:hypothetical protein